jgi:hypothetical protein
VDSVLVRVCGNVRYQATVGRRYDEALSWLNKGLDFAHALESTSALFFTQTNQGLAHLLIEDLNHATHAFCDALTACRDSVEDVSVRPETVGSSWKRK